MLLAVGGEQSYLFETHRENSVLLTDMSSRKTVLTEPKQHGFFQSLTNVGGKKIQIPSSSFPVLLKVLRTVGEGKLRSICEGHSSGAQVH